MKKHKVEIPEGYEIDSTTTESYTDNDGKKCYPRVIIKLKPIKKELPKTWGEYKHNDRPILETEPFDIVIPQKYTHPFHALIKLIQLRDHYNDGWEPDWNCDNFKPSIQVWIHEVGPINALCKQRLLTFKTEELRDKFLSNFRDLIETAKPLL